MKLTFVLCAVLFTRTFASPLGLLEDRAAELCGPLDEKCDGFVESRSP